MLQCTFLNMVWFLALPKGCGHAGGSSEKSLEDDQLVFQGRITVGCLFSFWFQKEMDMEGLGQQGSRALTEWCEKCGSVCHGMVPSGDAGGSEQETGDGASPGVGSRFFFPLRY